jgi:hypothetical protein
MTPLAAELTWATAHAAVPLGAAQGAGAKCSTAKARPDAGTRAGRALHTAAVGAGPAGATGQTRPAAGDASVALVAGERAIAARGLATRLPFRAAVGAATARASASLVSTLAAGGVTCATPAASARVAELSRAAGLVGGTAGPTAVKPGTGQPRLANTPGTARLIVPAAIQAPGGRGVAIKTGPRTDLLGTADLVFSATRAAGAAVADSACAQPAIAARLEALAAHAAAVQVAAVTRAARLTGGTTPDQRPVLSWSDVPGSVGVDDVGIGLAPVAGPSATGATAAA